MANALQQQMADDIASLVRKQTFAGSGVWRQSGNATLRIETQTDSLVNALQRLPSREEQEEEERESDRQHAEVIDALKVEPSTSGNTTSKKGGILGSLFAGLGKLGKSLGSIGKGALGFGKLGLAGITKSLGFLFSALKFIAGPLLLIGGLVFLTSDEKEQEKIINGIKDGLTSAFNFVKMLGTAFKGGFLEGYNEEGGLKESLTQFADAWGLVFDSLSETQFIPEAGKGLTGVFNWLGKGVASFAKGLVDLGTGLANLINNPTETLARIQANIEDFFMGIGQTIGQLFDKFFNFEFILSLLPEPLQAAARNLDIPQKAAEKRFQEKKKEIEISEENIKNLQERISINEKKLEEERKKGDLADKTKIRNLSLNIQRNKNEIEREEDNISFAREAAEKSKEKIIQEEVNKRFEKVAGVDRKSKLSKIASFESDLTKYTTEGRIGTVAGGTGATISQARILKDFVDKGGDISSSTGISLMEELGFAAGTSGFESNEILKRKLIGTELSAAESRIRNRISLISNLKEELSAQEGDLLPRIQAQVLASYLPNSGAVINELQMERTMGGTTGSAGTVIVDNSQQPTIINQTNVAAPQTKGPALVGEGRDKVNMR